MAKLDKSKPYGEVFGDPQGHRYEQDGKLFDALGEEIVVKAKDTPKQPTQPKQPAASGKGKDVQAAASAKPANAQVAAALKDE
jgi:hypothetical protein